MHSKKTSRIDQILAVDDIPDNLFLIEAILEDEGYAITLVSDGPSALAHIHKHPPDLILLDVMMPGMDGYQVTQRIRENKSLPYIPILLITAHDQSDVVKGLDVGADDFVRKPFDPDELMARIRSLLRLKHSIDALEELARQRQDFVSRLTHDLRTPLVAADRMMQLMQQHAFGALPAGMGEAIATMIRSNQNLLRMVNTLLEVQRFEAGQKTLNFSSCDMAAIAQDVIQELAPLAQEKQLQLKLDIALSDLDANWYRVRGDCLELQRVLTNLVGNSIKFTDAGVITLRLSPAPQPTLDHQSVAKPWLQIEVEDTGAGIAPDEIASVFNRFRQGRHRRSGSGLGLYLSRRIIQEHGGTIEVQSELGKGSLFRILLPG